MKLSQAAALLTLAAGRDNRTIAEAAAQVWAEDLGEARFVDCREAISIHYRETRDWIMPADILRIVRKTRADRLSGIEKPIPPYELADLPEAAMAWTRTFQHAICDGASRDLAIAEANTAFRIQPDDEPLALTAGESAVADMKAWSLEQAREKSVKFQEAEAERADKAERFRLAKAQRADELRMAEAADAFARAKSLDAQEAAVKAEEFRVAKADRAAAPEHRHEFTSAVDDARTTTEKDTL